MQPRTLPRASFASRREISHPAAKFTAVPASRRALHPRGRVKPRERASTVLRAYTTTTTVGVGGRLVERLAVCRRHGVATIPRVPSAITLSSAPNEGTQRASRFKCEIKNVWNRVKREKVLSYYCYVQKNVLQLRRRFCRHTTDDFKFFQASF